MLEHLQGDIIITTIIIDTIWNWTLFVSDNGFHILELIYISIVIMVSLFTLTLKSASHIVCLLTWIVYMTIYIDIDLSKIHTLIKRAKAHHTGMRTLLQTKSFTLLQ